MKTKTENRITQTPHFLLGQRVVVTPKWNEPYYTLQATVREVTKGEEVWEYYVKYQTRDYRGQTGGLFFAEEMKPLNPQTI